jgi:hypothetical protein
MATNKFPIDVSKFKHVSSDQEKTVLQHPAGHTITVMHKALSGPFRAQLEALSHASKEAETPLKQTRKMYANPQAPVSANDQAPAISYALDPNPPQMDYKPQPGPLVTPTTPEAMYPAVNFKGQEVAPPRGEFQATPPHKNKSIIEQLDEAFPADDVDMPNSQKVQQLDQQSMQPREKTPEELKNEAFAKQFNNENVYKSAQGAFNQEAKAIKDLGQRNAVIEQERQMRLQTQNDHEQQQMSKAAQHIEDAIKATQGPNAEINPNHYFENMSTGSKVASAIGLLLGGIGSGLTQGPNPAQQFLQQQVDRDIEAQTKNLSNKQNIIGAFQHLYGDKTVALNMARSFQNGLYASKIAESAAKAQGPIAQAKAAQAMLPFKQAQMQYLQQAQMLNSLQNPGPTGMNERDPAEYVARIVPEHAQAKVNAEIEAAQNTVHNAPGIMAAFEEASHNHSHLKDYVPGMPNRAQQQLHALLGPTFKDIEGSVRQGAMENLFKNVIPNFSDSKADIEAKKQALQGYLTSKSAAPTAKNYGIDLSKFRSTSTMPSTFLKPRQQQVLQQFKQMNPGVPDDKAIEFLKRKGHI